MREVPGVDYAVSAPSNADGDLAGADCPTLCAETSIALEIIGPDASDYEKATARFEELPIQLPIKVELVVNSRAAKALGLSLPPTSIARAEEVIE
jgi:hypothetical protein